MCLCDTNHHHYPSAPSLPSTPRRRLQTSAVTRMCRHFDLPFMLQLTGQCAKHLTQISLVLINVQNYPTHPLLRTRNLLQAQTDTNTPQDCRQNCIKGWPSLGGWAAVWIASYKTSRRNRDTRWMTGIPVFRCRRWGLGASRCNPCCHELGSPPVRETSCVQSGYREGLRPSRGRSHTSSPLMCSCPFSFPVCAGLKGERVHSSGPGGFTKGWWEMFVVQHWNQVHPAHLKPLPVIRKLQSEEE